MTTDLFNILSKNQFPLSKWVWIIIIIIATAESLVITALTTDNKIIKITASTNIDITIN